MNLSANLAAPPLRPLSSAVDSVRQALALRHASRRLAAEPGREEELLDSLREGDDGAFIYRMLRAAWGREPSPRLYAERAATLRTGTVNRYELMVQETARVAAGEPAQAAPGPVDTARFLARDLFHLAEFEALAPEAFVTAAFCACLKRLPDRFSYAHYLGLLRSGRMNRTEVLASLLDSDEAKLRGLATAIFGVSGVDVEPRIAEALAALHARAERLEYLAAFLQAQQQRLGRRLARLEARIDLG
jgi:hypothetical protein